MKVVKQLKIQTMILFFLLLLLSACNPVQNNPEVDCNLTPTHVDCIEEVDCLLTPDHIDCVEDIDCAVTPNHEDCVEEVDCAITPDHVDCVEEVDCSVTPEHEDCTNEPEECDNNQIEVDNECITLSGPQMLLHQSLLAMSTQESYQMDIVIDSPNDMTYTAMIMIDGLTSMYQDEGETIYYQQNGDICLETVIRWNQTSTETIDCNSQSSRFYLAFQYDMFELVSGQFHLQEDSFTILDNVITSIDPDASLISLTMQVSSSGIDRLVMTIELQEQSYIMTYTFGGYGTTVVTVDEGGMSE